MIDMKHRIDSYMSSSRLIQNFERLLDLTIAARFIYAKTIIMRTEPHRDSATEQ